MIESRLATDLSVSYHMLISDFVNYENNICLHSGSDVYRLVKWGNYIEGFI